MTGVTPLRGASKLWQPAKGHKGLFAILLIYLCLGLLLPPTYDMPFIDSWSYSWTAKVLAERGRFELAGWSDMSLVAHVAWGALYCRLSGFSFSVLNFSTYLLSLLCIFAFYLTLCQQRIGQRWAWLASLALVFNPIFFLLSRTFMTDVPFLTWMMFGTWAYAQGLEGDNLGQVFLGSIFCTLSLAIRQNGVLLALAAGCHLLLGHGRRVGWKRLLAAGLLPLLTMGAFYFSWGGIALTTNPFDQVVAVAELVGFAMDWWEIWARGGPWQAVGFVLAGGGYLLLVALKMLLYGGFFLLPLTLPGFLTSLRKARIYQAGATLAFWGALVALGTGLLALQAEFIPHLGRRRSMPCLRDLITPFGIGGENEWLMGERCAYLPGWFWWLVTVLSAFSAVALLVALHQRVAHLWPGRRLAVRQDADISSEFFIYLAAGWQLAFFLAVEISGEVFDRHTLVFILPLGLAYLKFVQGKLRASWGIALVLAAFLGYCLVTTSHYFAWNQARWQAAQKLVAEGVAPLEIEGGFEWNGWQAAQDRGSAVQGRELPPGAPWYYLLFPQVIPRYVISFSPLPGYRAVEEREYSSPFHWSSGSVLVLERLPRQGRPP